VAHESICVVEDELDIAELIAYNLKKEGYGVRVVQTGEEAIPRISETVPDLVILDLMLPGVDGLEVCRRLKQGDATRDVPVIMLTAKSEDSDIIAGLEVGADDYITKPFSPRILVARIRAVLRRARFREEAQSLSRITIHGIEIDVPRHEVKCNGQVVPLSATEFGVLHFLAGSPGWVFSRRKIISAVKGDDYWVTERSVDVQILGLRKKLGSCGDAIETIRGFGYRMREEGE
jgi:two-component system phosphate regulon response regulator PhoB